MPQVTPIVLTDGTNSETLGPVSTEQFLTEDKATAAAQWRGKLTNSVNKTAARAFMRIEMPFTYVDSTTGLTEVKDTAIATIEIRCPKDLPVSERENFVKKVFSAGDDASVAAVMASGQSLY